MTCGYVYMSVCMHISACICVCFSVSVCMCVVCVVCMFMCVCVLCMYFSVCVRVCVQAHVWVKTLSQAPATCQRSLLSANFKATEQVRDSFPCWFRRGSRLALRLQSHGRAGDEQICHVLFNLIITLSRQTLIETSELSEESLDKTQPCQAQPSSPSPHASLLLLRSALLKRSRNLFKCSSLEQALESTLLTSHLTHTVMMFPDPISQVETLSQRAQRARSASHRQQSLLCISALLPYTPSSRDD